jgi:hypothetical protein
MKKKLNVFWITAIVAALVFELALVGCSNGTTSDDDDNGNSKKLVIENIGISGDVLVILTEEWGPSETTKPAGGTITGVVAGSDVTITLKSVVNGAFSTNNWEGDGEYYIYLHNTLTPSGEPDYAAQNDDNSKIDFSNQITKVDWSKFSK